MDFNFQGLATALATISFGIAGLVMAGSMIFPQAAAQYKRQIQDVIIGLILVMVASFIVNSLGGG
jgi:type IV secretory pathway VirB2 component (pilin)